MLRKETQYYITTVAFTVSAIRVGGIMNRVPCSLAAVVSTEENVPNDCIGQWRNAV